MAIRSTRAAEPTPICLESSCSRRMTTRPEQQWLTCLEENLEIAVGCTIEPVHMVLTGDDSLLTAHYGYAGASSSMPYLCCAAWARPTCANVSLLETCGNIQTGRSAGGCPLTCLYLENMVMACEIQPLAYLFVPFAMTEHLSVENAP